MRGSRKVHGAADGGAGGCPRSESLVRSGLQERQIIKIIKKRFPLIF